MQHFQNGEWDKNTKRNCQYILRMANGNMHANATFENSEWDLKNVSFKTK
jgi:hypothetical protein